VFEGGEREREEKARGAEERGGNMERSEK
jgi:hypothetical protein